MKGTRQRWGARAESGEGRHTTLSSQAARAARYAYGVRAPSTRMSHSQRRNVSFYCFFILNRTSQHDTQDTAYPDPTREGRGRRCQWTHARAAARGSW